MTLENQEKNSEKPDDHQRSFENSLNFLTNFRQKISMIFQVQFQFCVFLMDIHVCHLAILRF